MASNVEITLISGFFGAGKTTLIRRLLSGVIPTENTVILENEFGAADIDGDILRSGGALVVSVKAGCICCTGAGDFLSAINEIIDKYSPERIIIEPTGLAKLSELIALLTDSASLGKICTLKTVITVVDASAFNRRMLISKDFFEDQIRSSREIIINRAENLSDEEIADIQKQIEVIRASRKEAYDQEQNRIDDIHSASWTDSVQRENAFVSAFSKALSGGELGEVLRVKGWLLFHDGDTRTVDYTPGEFAVGESLLKKKTELCFIGKNIYGRKLRRFFNEN
jgi:G3E family GTPase